MKETAYLTMEECLRLHGRMLDLFGGSSGLRDPGLLESALARPRSGYYQTIFEQAAALMQSLAVNHCFVDGNKRIAMGCAYTFLAVNGYTLIPDGEGGEKFLINQVIVGRVGVEEIAKWLAANTSTSNPERDIVGEQADRPKRAQSAGKGIQAAPKKKKR